MTENSRLNRIVELIERLVINELEKALPKPESESESNTPHGNTQDTEIDVIDKRVEMYLENLGE